MYASTKIFFTKGVGRHRDSRSLFEAACGVEFA